MDGARRPAAVRHFAGLLVAIGVLVFPVAARAHIDATVEPQRIEAGLFYDGATLRIDGSVAADSQLALRITGPSEHHVFNRRAKIAGVVWGGVEHVSFHRAPSLYAVFTSAALPMVARPDVRRRLQLGYDTLEATMEVEGAHAPKQLMIDQFVRLKEREGLFRVAPGAVHFEEAEGGRRHFEMLVAVPAAAPAGDLEVAAFELQRGTVVSQAVRRVTLTHVGLPASLHQLAHQNGTWFGLLAAAVALMIGLATDALGSVRRPEWRRRTGRLLEAAGRELVALVPGLRLPLRSPEAVARLHAKYQLFRNILDLNNELLELLAELEEDSSWTSFGHPRVRMGIRALFDGTTDMVGLLNQLSGNEYFDLGNVVASIRRDVSAALAAAPEQPPPLTLAMHEISSKTAGYVGGKAVNLARVAHDLQLSVPAFFVVTTEAYREFLEQNRLASELRTVLGPARLEAEEDFRRRCELAQELTDRAGVPAAVVRAMSDAYRELGLEAGEGVAVRSSAPGEDSELSFAGQFESVLNVPESGLVEAWKQVVRSRFSPRAVFYRRAAGLAEVDTPMAVLVQRMVRPRASGVLFTRHPEQAKRNAVLITAAPGLGADVSTGIAAADELLVSRPPRRVLERRLGRKHARLVEQVGGGIEKRPINGDEQLRSCLSDDEALRLAERALQVERYFGGPQDIEWAIDGGGEIVLLQARPLRTEKVAGPLEAPTVAPLLRARDMIWPGRAVGPIHLARTPADEERLRTGAILLVPQLLPDCVRLLPRVCGIIAECGTLTGHAASVVREFRVPCVFGAVGASEQLEDGQMVSLDAATGAVYEGALWPELRGHLPVTLLGRRAVGLPKVLASKLTKLSGSSFMSSWTCQSLHDVIRFVHEMAIQRMFSIGDRLAESRIGGVKRLECDTPVYLHVIDLGGGLSPEAAARGSIAPEDVLSLPFQGLWRGLADEAFVSQRLEEPGVSSFASVVMSTAVGGAGRSLDAPNYACVTDNYLNLNSRQAYHFAVVDAFLSDRDNNNHVSLRLKGGGAAPWQRELRAEFIAEVLRLHLFNTTVQGDLVNGWRRGLDAQTGLKVLTVLGHLLRFSAQLDMWMLDENSVRRYTRMFADAERAAVGQDHSPTRSTST